MKKTLRAGLAGLGAFGTLVVAMGLSLVLAVPASAAGGVPDPPKTPAEVKYKYGYDYFAREWLPDNDPNSPTYRKLRAQRATQQPVNQSIHPATRKYLDKVTKQEQTRSVNSGNKPVVGKVIEPGKTPLRPPSVYKKIPIPGAALSGKIFGAAGLGIGGTAVAPTNTKDLLVAQGGSAGCDVNTMAGCSTTDIDKIMSINGCGLTGTCTSIGAKGVDGGDVDFFATNVIPFFEDLWARLTGQKSEPAVNADGHWSYIKGCNKRFDGFELTGPQAGTLYMGTAANNKASQQFAKPGTAFEGARWEEDCGLQRNPLDYATNWGLGSRVKTQCLGSDGKTSDATGNLGIDLGTPSVFDAPNSMTAANKTPLCLRGATLFKLQLTFTSNNQSNAYEYQTHEYFEWLNPDPAKTIEESLTTTTTVQCKVAANNKTYSYSTTTVATAGFREPACPEGSEIQSHEVKASSPNGPTYNVDKGAVDPVESLKYPDCVGSPCAMQVQLDGTDCTAARADCGTWPTIAAKTPSRVVCKWGGYSVKLSDCNVLSNAYKTEAGVVYDPISDHFPAIDEYGTPTASNPEPWNPTNPNPVPGSTTSAPPTTGATAPTEGVNPSTVPGTAGENCLAHGWSWNPVSWVMVPTQCALQWAFVPPQARLDAATAVIQPKLELRGIEPFVTPFMTNFGDVGGTGCKGPGIDVNPIGISEVLYPFDACQEPLSNVALATNSFLSLSIVLQGGMSCIRGVAAAFGFNWGLTGKETAVAT